MPDGFHFLAVMRKRVQAEKLCFFIICAVSYVVAGRKKRKQLTYFFFLINFVYAQQGRKKEEVYEKRK